MYLAAIEPWHTSVSLVVLGGGPRAQELWHVASLPRGMWQADLSSLTMDRTCLPCAGRQTVNHQTTRKSPISTLFVNIIFIMM